MPDTSTPLRFRTPPGWPTPSAEWVELFQGAEPAAGWTPADAVPPAPRGWAFWVSTRVLRRRVPRSLAVVTNVGAVVATLSLGVLVGLVIVGGADSGVLAVAALAALVPLIAGIALWVVGAVRLADRRRAALAAVLAEAARRRAVELPERVRAAHPDTDPGTAFASWDAAAWSLPAAHPFHEGAPSRMSARVDRVLTVLTAGFAGLVLVAGASFAVAPPIVHTAESIAAEAAADPYTDDSPVEVWSSDDGSTTASWLVGDDEWDATCGTTDGDDFCDPYEIDTERSCLAVVTIGYFADYDDEDPSRVEERTVELSADVPLVLAVSYQDEEDSIIGDVSCTSGDAAAADRVTATQDVDAHPDAADLPDGCDGPCVAIAVTPTTDCASASVAYRVDAEVGGLTDPHDVVVPTALRAGEAVQVFAGGTDEASAVHPGTVTCHVTTSDGYSEDS